MRERPVGSGRWGRAWYLAAEAIGAQRAARWAVRVAECGGCWGGMHGQTSATVDLDSPDRVAAQQIEPPGMAMPPLALQACCRPCAVGCVGRLAALGAVWRNDSVGVWGSVTGSS